MYADLNEQLNRAMDDVLRLNSARTKLASLRGRKEELEGKARALKAALDKEEADVAAASGRSLSALFSALTGRRQEHIARQEQEALEARLRLDTVKSELACVAGDIDALNSQAAELYGCEARYDSLYRQKLELLRSNGAEICQLEQSIAELRSQDREIGQALSAGRRALDQIGVIESDLDGAEGWGVMDLVGGGLISHMAKHSHLDTAQDNISQLQNTLLRFRTELADVRVDASIQAQIDGFLRFADWFFDGLIADWTVLSRIHDSQEQLRKTRSQVSSAVSALERLQRGNATKLKSLQMQLETAVREA